MNKTSSLHEGTDLRLALRGWQQSSSFLLAAWLRVALNALRGFRDCDSGSGLSDSGLPVLNLVPLGCDLCLAAQDSILFGSVLDA